MPTLNHRLPETTDAHSKVGAAEKQLHRLKQSEPNMEQYSSRKVKSSTIPIEANINPAHGKRKQKYILNAYIRQVPREKLLPLTPSH